MLETAFAHCSALSLIPAASRTKGVIADALVSGVSARCTCSCVSARSRDESSLRERNGHDECLHRPPVRHLPRAGSCRPVRGRQASGVAKALVRARALRTSAARGRVLQRQHLRLPTWQSRPPCLVRTREAVGTLDQLSPCNGVREVPACESGRRGMNGVRREHAQSVYAARTSRR
jgi:hypothetical protein